MRAKALHGSLVPKRVGSGHGPLWAETSDAGLNKIYKTFITSVLFVSQIMSLVRNNEGIIA